MLSSFRPTLHGLNTKFLMLRRSFSEKSNEADGQSEFLRRARTERSKSSNLLLKLGIVLDTSALAKIKSLFLSLVKNQSSPMNALMC